MIDAFRTKAISSYFYNSGQFYYILTDLSGNCFHINPLFLQQNGFAGEDIQGTSFSSFIPSGEWDRYTAILKECVANPGSSLAADFHHHLPDGSYILARWEFQPLPGEYNEADSIQCIGTRIREQQDITEKKKAEEQLLRSELFYRNLIGDSLDGILLTDTNGLITFASPSVEKILGYQPEDILQTSAFAYVHPDDQAIAFSTFQDEVRMEPLIKFIDIRLRAKSGEWVYCNVRGHNMLYNPYISRMVIYFTDDSRRKEMEDRLGESQQELVSQEIQKQKLLTQATIDGQEKERKEIGKELHDNISQRLTTTRLYLEVAEERAVREDVKELIHHAHKELTDIFNEIRKLSQSLVPPTLGDIGLVESIRDVCTSLKRTHTITVNFYHSSFTEDNIPDNMKLMLFRIIQEQINNIIRHAAATTIHIRLQSDAESLELNITDNGQGFDPAISDKKGLGFTNIISRVGLFNGKVDLQSAPGKGCTILVMVPLR